MTLPWLVLSLAACRDDPTWTPAADDFAPWPDEAGAAIPVPDALAELDWLADPSRYGWRGVPSGRATAGTFGLGNGVVFALTGLDDPPDTLTNAIGPGYQADDGFFGDVVMTLEEDGAPLPVTDAAVQRPRGAAVVRAAVESEGLVRVVTDVAPPGEAYLARHVAVRDEGGGARDLRLRWRLTRGDDEAAPDGEGLLQRRGDRWMRLHCPDAVVDGDALVVDVALPEGGEWATTCVVAFAEGGPPEAPEVDVVAALQASREETTAWLEAGVTLEVPDPKVADLVEGMLLTTRVQTASLGVPSPMSRYTSGWLRDTEGPVRLWLRTGHDDDALAALRGLWLGELAAGAIQNSFSLDVDPDAVPLPDDPSAWWAAVPFMPGREAAEAPSFAVLLHEEAAAWTGEAWDEQREAFLDACLDRQEIVDGRLPFSGDETFRWPMAFAVGDLPEALGTSANSTFLWRAAARARGRDPEALSADPYWTGTFWAPIVGWDDGAPLGDPYEDIAMQPTWWDAALPEEQVAANWEASMAALLRDDGTLLSRRAGSSDDNVGFTGMVPGYLLAGAAAQHAPEEGVAFAALDAVATPSGHFEELHGPDLVPLALQHDADGLGGDVSARYRPWEGGVVVSALLDYLLGARPSEDGLALSPHLPDGWSGFAVRGLRVRGALVDVEVTRYAEGLGVVVTGGEGGTLRLTLHGAFDAAWVGREELSADGEQITVTMTWGPRVEVWARSAR